MRLKTSFLIFLIILASFAHCKRSGGGGGGRGRGSSGRSSSFWTRKSKSSSDSKPAATPPKHEAVPPKPISTVSRPSAPKKPEIKKEAAKVQQSAPPNPQNAQRPAGWNVDSNNNMQKNVNPPAYSAANPNPQNAEGPIGWNVYSNNKQLSEPPNSHRWYVNSNSNMQKNVNPPAYSAANPNPQNAQRPIGWNVDSNNNMQKSVHPPAYSAANPHNTGGYPHNPAYPNSGVYPQQAGGSPGFGHQGQAHYPNRGYQHPTGGYPNNMGGFGHPQQNAGMGYQGQHNYSNYGGYPGYQQPMGGGFGYPQQNTGMGSFFGGNKHGYGGYGGYGGFGGYGMKKSGGFFGKHAFRNVLGGLFVWYLVSGLVSKPYKVYNYYNRPEEVREEIKLPANMLTLCNENATNICVPGTTAICTQDQKILCVSTISSTTPCQGNAGGLCVNTTIPCVDGNDPLCQNKTTSDNTTTVNLPCFTNMTLDSSGTLPTNVTLPASDGNKFCVTTMAVPDPSIPVEDGKTPEIQQSANVTNIPTRNSSD